MYTNSRIKELRQKAREERAKEIENIKFLIKGDVLEEYFVIDEGKAIFRIKAACFFKGKPRVLFQKDYPNTRGFAFKHSKFGFKVVSNTFIGKGSLKGFEILLENFELRKLEEFDEVSTPLVLEDSPMYLDNRCIVNSSIEISEAWYSNCKFVDCKITIMDSFACAVTFEDCDFINCTFDTKDYKKEKRGIEGFVKGCGIYQSSINGNPLNILNTNTTYYPERIRSVLGEIGG